MNDQVTVDRLHQLNIHGNGLELKTPPLLAGYSSVSVRRMYPEAEYTIWSENDVRDLIKSNLDGSVYTAFDLASPQIKAELSKYCILYMLGGLYVSNDIYLANKWQIPAEYSVGAFNRSNMRTDDWPSIGTNLLWSRPNRPEWAAAITATVASWRASLECGRMSDFAGSSILGRAFATVMMGSNHRSDAEDQWVGDTRLASLAGMKTHFACVAPDRTLVGFYQVEIEA